MLIQPNFTIIVISVGNEGGKVGKTVTTTPSGTKVLCSALGLALVSLLFFSATGGKSGPYPASSQSHLTATG